MAEDVTDNFEGPQSYSRPKYGGVITSQSTFITGTVGLGLAGATFSDPRPLQSGVRLNPSGMGASTTAYVGSDAGVTTDNGYQLDGEVFIDVDDLSKVFVCADATGSTLSFIAS